MCSCCPEDTRVLSVCKAICGICRAIANDPALYRLTVFCERKIYRIAMSDIFSVRNVSCNTAYAGRSLYGGIFHVAPFESKIFIRIRNDRRSCRLIRIGVFKIAVNKPEIFYHGVSSVISACICNKTEIFILIGYTAEVSYLLAVTVEGRAVSTLSYSNGSPAEIRKLRIVLKHSKINIINKLCSIDRRAALKRVYVLGVPYKVADRLYLVYALLLVEQRLFKMRMSVAYSRGEVAVHHGIYEIAAARVAFRAHCTVNVLTLTVTRLWAVHISFLIHGKIVIAKLTTSEMDVSVSEKSVLSTVLTEILIPYDTGITVLINVCTDIGKIVSTKLRFAIYAGVESRAGRRSCWICLVPAHLNEL